MNFQQKIDRLVKKNDSLLCIGLDPDFDKLPLIVKKERHPQFAFNKAIIEATHDLVCSYKPNAAFYESRGAEGIMELKKTMDYVRTLYPEIPIILDAKRADIGSTNEGYVDFAYTYLQADAITLHPYLGQEALKPFLDQKDKFSFILCRTSNPGAGEFQDLQVGKSTLYQEVAKHVSNAWNNKGNCGLVVGATYPDELKVVRRLIKNMLLLIPGTGAQGGDLEMSMKNGQRARGDGVIISTSRSILFAGSGPDFANVARNEAQKLRDEINAHRKH